MVVGKEYPEQMLQQQRLCKKQNSAENGELQGRYEKQFGADTQKIDITPAINIILIMEIILWKSWISKFISKLVYSKENATCTALGRQVFI